MRMRHGLLLAIAAVGLSTAAATSYPGITEPVRDETFSATVSGRIDKVLPQEGQTVAVNDVLVQLESEMETLEVARRKLLWEDKSKLEAAKIRQASKQTALEVARRKLIWETKDELTAARKRLTTLETDLAGTRELFTTTQSVSKDQLAAKELEVSVARAEVAELESREKREELDYEVAKDNDALTAALNLAQVQALEMEEAREKIEYDAALAQLARRQVRSSIAGVVRAVMLHPGENCSAGQPLIQVVDARRVRFIANVDAAATEGVSAGDPVTLAFSLPTGAITKLGTVTFLSPVVDAASGLREVKAEFDNADGLVTPGIAGEIRFEAEK